MINKQIQVACSGAVCKKAELKKWQNVIPYGGTKGHNVVIVR
jgi:hypothetical protein